MNEEEQKLAITIEVRASGGVLSGLVRTISDIYRASLEPTPVHVEDTNDDDTATDAPAWTLLVPDALAEAATRGTPGRRDGDSVADGYEVRWGLTYIGYVEADVTWAQFIERFYETMPREPGNAYAFSLRPCHGPLMNAQPIPHAYPIPIAVTYDNPVLRAYREKQ